MKKMFKTSLAVAMSVCMAAALTACGGSGSASSSAPADSGAAAETTESADTGAKIKIGGSGPLTGPAAVYGQAVKNAAEIAVEEVNAKGGLQFELNMQDDAHDPEKAVTAYGVLKDWGMQASLATVTSAPGAAVSPLTFPALSEMFSRCASQTPTRELQARTISPDMLIWAAR